MVDLAKIRKKAKEKKEEKAKALDETSASAPDSPQTTTTAPEGKPGPGPGPGLPEKTAKPAPKREPAPAAQPAQPPEDRSTAKLERFRETAGRLSAAALAAVEAADTVPEEARLELLTFVMGGEQYAIDIERIAEIIAPRQATPVPNAPRPVVGIISLRGTIVTMLDLRRELGHATAAAIGPETRTIVVDDGGSLAGFTVDRVLRVVKVAPQQIQPHPVVSPAEQSAAVRGVFQSGTSLTIVLDVEKLLGRG